MVGAECVFSCLSGGPVAFFSLHKEQPSETNQSFLDLVALMIVLIVADSLGRIVGASDSLFFWVRAGNFISYVLNPMIILLWMRYQSNWMEIPQKQRNLWLLPVLGFVIFNLILTIISEHTGRSYFSTTPEDTGADRCFCFGRPSSLQ